MARVLIVVPPLSGHINPAVAVAHELVQRGHSVAWAAHSALVRERLPAGAQVYALPVDAKLEQVIVSPPVRGAESVEFFFEDFYVPMVRSSLPAVEAAISDFRPDVVLCDQQMLSGALAARRAGVYWLTLATTSASILKASDKLDEWVAGQLGDLQREFGLSPVLEHPDFSPYGVVVFSSEKLVGTKYPRVPAHYHFVGLACGHRAIVPDFPWELLRQDVPRLFISLGTVNRDRDLRFYRVMMEALRDLPLQVVMVAPEAIIEEAPANFIVQTRVPQLELLPHMNAVITHAGHNTVCEALSCGLPLIVAPIRDDQPFVARQVMDAGAGIFMRHGKVSVAVARKTVQELFADETLRENAVRLAQSFLPLGGAAQVADIIENRQVECAA
jgi:MGT family glycosyltransferase